MSNYLVVRTGSGPLVVGVAPRSLTLAASTGTFALTGVVAGLAVGTPAYPTAAAIVTPDDTVPNFAKDATILSAQSGDWSSASTWSLGRVPQAGDIVGIKTTHVVTYDVVSTAAIVAVGIAGTLAFRADIGTKLTVQHLMVYGEPTLAAGTYGTLQIGTAAAPVDAAVTAEVVFSDVAIDTGTVSVPGPDPRQFGNGLLVWGKILTHGAIKTPWLRVAAEPAAGHTSFTLTSAVSGWRVGDLLVVPDTRQLNLAVADHWASYAPRWETRTLSSLASGNTVANLSSALTYDHFGGEHGYGIGEGTGAAAFYPHVGNLARNVVFRSANGAGTRGHGMFFDRADVDIRYSRFTEMGRTSNATLDSATFSGATLTHVGTNQIGRYAIHIHHVMGPVATPANGYQYTLVGNAVDDPLPAPPSAALPASKWGLTVHGSHYGLIADNVIHHTAGANVITEDGSESFNVFERNFSLNCIGDKNPRSVEGTSGNGFFFNGFNNHVRDNVAAGIAGTFQEIVAGSGFEYFVPPGSAATVRDPLFPGADTHDGVEGVDFEVVNIKLQPLLEFAGNEAYGAMAGGMTIWHLGSDGYSNPTGMPASTVLDLRVWNAFEEAFFGYPTMNLTFDGLVVRGDPAANNVFNRPIGLLWGDYWAGGATAIRNSDIRGYYYGFADSLNVHGTLTIEDSYFRCEGRDVAIRPPSTAGSGSGSEDHTFNIINCVLDQFGSNVNYYKIAMDYSITYANTNLRVKQVVNVVGLDGVPGDDFRLYYAEQAGGYAMPATGGDVSVGCPESGLTNAQAYVKYHQDGTLKSPTGSLSDPEGCAIAGAVAPGTATTRAGILGLLDEG